MPKPVNSGPYRQFTLEWDEDLARRHGSLRDCLAQQIYQRGLKRVAGELNVAPGNLSVQLSDSDARKFSLDELERYIERFNDPSPILYLVAKYLQAQPDERADALGQVADLLEQLPGMLANAGYRR